MSQDIQVLVIKIVEKLQKERNENGTKSRPQRGHRNVSTEESKFDADLALKILVQIVQYNLVPISVQQRVIALHPSSKELRTAKILCQQVGEKQDAPIQYRSQFDNADLGVPYINDSDLVPISSQGANWDLLR